MHDLLIVGAGPYGLSIAAHAAAAGLDVRVFGKPMASWRDHMPRGMFLKSEPWASDLSDPGARYGLAAYCAREGLRAEHGVPLPVEHFAAYGLWFAERAAPPVDERLIRSVRPRADGFAVTTADGETCHGRTVALAVGVMPFVEIPSLVRGLGPAHVSHSSHHADLRPLRDKDVTVLGAGQAALETAALLAEQGTRVRVLARAPQVRWNTLPPSLDRPWWQSARAPHSGLGCGWRNWFYAERPGLFRLLPEPTRARVCATALGPAGAWWVRDRVEGGTTAGAAGSGTAIEIVTGHRLTGARHHDGQVLLDTQGPEGAAVFETDHVLAATGFRALTHRIDVLDLGVRDTLRRLPDGSPYVDSAFETSLPGLFVAGLPTASSFGPAMRFVQGAGFTAARLVTGVRRRVRRLGSVPVARGAEAPDRSPYASGTPGH
ncbi:NAD(P)-binding domain-containing protein [Streptomyces flavofungini]|uniref:NAD(P)-binding domain-containing protein n=1 Tax=Streptomyces flavofungini TaxID=68200 RepID=UPI0025B21956|nr:NAD(P)-binding domain-containing protein [Streptomyces flavofungini]WJV47504.1 NAD(P)-binding domain-containing protein [Streptomyces flavofungini]